MLGTVVLFVDSIGKHYKRVIEGQAIKILGSVDFLGNPVGLISDVASGKPKFGICHELCFNALLNQRYQRENIHLPLGVSRTCIKFQ